MQELKEQKIWLLWQWEDRDGKRTKVPKSVKKRQIVRHERKVGAHMGQLSARQNALQTGGSRHDP